MKKFISTVCLTAVLSVNVSPVNAQIALELLKPVLEGISTAAAEAILDAILAPQESAFYAFTDGKWLVTIGENGSDLIYHGVNLETEDSITLAGVAFEGDSQRQVFTWNNGSYRYQVAYRPNDPDVIRLQVFEGSEELLNRLLYRYENR